MRRIHGIVCEANGNPAADRFFVVQDPIMNVWSGWPYTEISVKFHHTSSLKENPKEYSGTSSGSSAVFLTCPPVANTPSNGAGTAAAAADRLDQNSL
jgi:hypothetical protein